MKMDVTVKDECLNGVKEEHDDTDVHEESSDISEIHDETVELGELSEESDESSVESEEFLDDLDQVLDQ